MPDVVSIIRNPVAAVIALLICTPMARGQTVDIGLRSDKVAVDSVTIRVSDLADVRCSDAQMARRIGDLTVEQFTGEVTSVEISGEQIRWLATLAGIAGDNIRVTGPELVEARYQSSSLLANEIGEWIAESLAAGFGADSAMITVHVPDTSLNDFFRSKWNSSARDERAVLLPERLVPGRQMARVRFGDQQPVSVPVTVSLNREVAVTVRGLPAGHTITADDLQTVVRPVESSTARPVSVEVAIGKTIRRPLQPFELIDESFLQSVSATGQFGVRRGSTVKVVLQVGNFAMQIPNARATGSGNPGDEITVQNVSSGKQLRCRVVDSNTVELLR